MLMVRSMNITEETKPVQVHFSLPQLFSRLRNKLNCYCITLYTQQNGHAMENLTIRPANVSNHQQQRTRFDPNAASRNLSRHYNPYRKPGNTQQIPRYHTPSPTIMSTKETRHTYNETNPFTRNDTATVRRPKHWK